MVGPDPETDPVTARIIENSLRPFDEPLRRFAKSMGGRYSKVPESGGWPMRSIVWGGTPQYDITITPEGWTAGERFPRRPSFTVRLYASFSRGRRGFKGLSWDVRGNVSFGRVAGVCRAFTRIARRIPKSLEEAEIVWEKRCQRRVKRPRKGDPLLL